MSVLPPVFVELKAKASEFHAALGEAEKDMQKLAKNAAGHGEMIRQGLGKGFMVAGGAMTGAGAVLEELGHKQETAAKDLEVAIKNTGSSYEEYAKRVSGAVTSQEKFGHTADDTKEALAVLTRATGNASTAMSDMKLVTELAAAKHISLAEAAGTVAKMHAGAYKPLKEFGINIKDSQKAVAELTLAEKDNDKASAELAKAKQNLTDLEARLAGKTKLTVAEQQQLRDAHQRLDEATKKAADSAKNLSAVQAEGAKAMDFQTASALVLQKIHGTAAAQADTFGGKIAGLKAHLTDVAGEIGQKFGPAMVTAGPIMMGLGAIIQSSIIPTIIDLGTSAIAAAGEVILAIAPIAIPLAVIGIAAYELYKHWDQVWGFIKRIAKDAFDFVKKHMDLIIDVALGPLGVAITFLSHHWSEVWDGMKTVAIDVADAIIWPYKTAFNLIADLWNHTIGSLSVHIPSWVPEIGGKGFDMPKIPKFHQGGIVPGPIGTETLAILQAGERVTPISGAGGSGDSVTVNVQVGTLVGSGGMDELANKIQAALLRKSRNNLAIGLV